MENKINIAELLKDCPKGMELDCTVYDNVTFGCIMDGNCYPIQIQTPEGNMLLSEYGCMSLSTHSKCVIFPKGKTTWEGFKKTFKDGDVVATNSGHWIGITTGGIYDESIPTYCIIDPNDSLRLYFDKPKSWSFNRLATEEEKQKLFDAIKANGYKWNEETKTLEKLVKPRFKVGDRIRNNQVDLGNIYTIIEVRESSYVVNKNNEHKNYNIDFVLQDEWELVSNKFDITTLVPFESRVLTRDDRYSIWLPNVWGLYDKEHRFPYVTTGNRYRYCIPYKGNEHLIGKTDDCDKYFKNW